ncbi:MAG: DUF177 domain-containing protein [Candidatus Eisenbacteria bacterium]
MEAPLRLQLRDIPQGESRYAVDLRADELDLVEAGAEAEFLGPVEIELELIRADEQLQVRGTARVSTRQRCARCLEPVERPLTTGLEIVARRRSERDGDEPAEGLILHDGEQIQLANEVRELILLSIPLAPVCRAECRGLCPQCGANLNAGPCACVPSTARDSRWAGLEGLRHAGADAQPGAGAGRKQDRK